VLAGFSLVIGLFLGPTGVYGRQLAQSSSLPGAGDHPHSLALMAISALIFAAGYGLARWMYVKSPAIPAKLEVVLRPLHRLSLGKFFFDELFAYLLVVPIRVIALLCTFLDRFLIDGLLNLIGAIPKTIGRIVRPIQNGIVASYAWVMLVAVVVLLIQALRGFAGSM
jgi:NADH-quinone oxidoreductase subunit L